MAAQGAGYLMHIENHTLCTVKCSESADIEEKTHSNDTAHICCTFPLDWNSQAALL